MRVHVYTNRNGRDLCGNVGHLSACWHDLKTVDGALRRAKIAAQHVSKLGDIIVLETASDDSPYEYAYAAHFMFLESSDV